METADHPLALQGMLQELMDIPSPPPVATGTPPPEVLARMEELDRLADQAYPASPVDSPPPQRMPDWGPWRVGNTVPEAARGMYQPIINNKWVNNYNHTIDTMNVALDTNNDDNTPAAALGTPPGAPPAGPLGPCGLP